MDFRQITQPGNNRPAPVAPTSAAPEQKEEKAPHTHKKSGIKWGRVLTGVILIGIAVLLAFTILAINRGGDNEFAYVKNTKYQAVFLNNGQVYFGNIKTANSEYIRLTNVFYLTQAGDQNSNYSLVKLGCQQIHDPSDQMVINRAQVTFWENLEDDGKVVASINQFKKQNPKGPDCTQVSNQTQADSNASTQGSGTNSTTNGTNTTNNSTNSSTNSTNTNSSSTANKQ